MRRNDHLPDFERRLAVLPGRSRLAFIALCLERVLPIAKHTLASPLPEEIVHLLWAFCEDVAGAPPRMDEVAEEISELVTDLQDSDIEDFRTATAQAFEEAVHGYLDENSESLAVAAANAADALAFDARGDAERLMHAESEKQRKLLETVEQAEEAHLRRDAFETVRERPDWLDAFFEQYGQDPNVPQP